MRILHWFILKNNIRNDSVCCFSIAAAKSINDQLFAYSIFIAWRTSLLPTGVSDLQKLHYHQSEVLSTEFHIILLDSEQLVQEYAHPLACHLLK